MWLGVLHTLTYCMRAASCRRPCPHPMHRDLNADHAFFTSDRFMHAGNLWRPHAGLESLPPAICSMAACGDEETRHTALGTRAP